MSVYIVPQELKSPVKVAKHFYLYDLVFILIFFCAMSVAGSCVHDAVKLFYNIYNILAALILTRASSFNPQKRIFQSIFYKLFRDRTVYHAI